jgi:starvation-inducible DNA-binding protein
MERDPFGEECGKDLALRRFGSVIDNPLGLETAKAQQIAKLLNADLASECVLYHQYKKHHWVATGPESHEIHLLLDELASDTLKCADLIAERLTALGAVPVSSPADFAQHCYFALEGNDVFSVRAMCKHDLKAEQAIIAKLREHIAAASAVGDYGTEQKLKTILALHEDHADDLACMLSGPGLRQAA